MHDTIDAKLIFFQSVNQKLKIFELLLLEKSIEALYTLPN